VPADARGPSRRKRVLDGGQAFVFCIPLANHESAVIGVLDVVAKHRIGSDDAKVLCTLAIDRSRL
jgi:hypothetical protein